MMGNANLRQNRDAMDFARRQILLSPDYLRIPLRAFAWPFLRDRFVSSGWAVALVFQLSRRPIIGAFFQVGAGVFTLFILRKIEIQFGITIPAQDNERGRSP